MRIVLAPLMGALIGYVTNYVAIKMLFRPSRPLFIGRFRLPFTPGLIPKEKQRLARSVGEIVGRDLLGGGAVREALLSEEMLARLREALGQAIRRGAAMEDTVADCFARLAGLESAKRLADQGKEAMARYLAQRLIEADVGATAAQSLTESLRRKAPGGLADFLSNVLDERIKQNLSGQVRSAVNGYIERHAQELLAQTVDREAAKLLNARVCDLAAAHWEALPALEDKLMDLYVRLIQSQAERVIEAVDVASIVRGRIESIDNGELERLILDVADRELKAIVYLGALLGFLMGFVNLLF